MPWDIYWTLMGQIVLALLILALPLGLVVSLVGSSLASNRERIARAEGKDTPAQKPASGSMSPRR